MQVLIIGSGNTLRNDDGVGYRIAETIAELDLTSVRSVPVHQLTPELAEEISRSAIAIFVDAFDTSNLEVATGSPTIELQPIHLAGHSADSTTRFTAHYVTPETLLTLAQELYGHQPTAYQLLIPAEDFEIGESFSPTTTVGYTLAIEAIQVFLAKLKF